MSYPKIHDEKVKKFKATCRAGFIVEVACGSINQDTLHDYIATESDVPDTIFKIYANNSKKNHYYVNFFNIVDAVYSFDIIKKTCKKIGSESIVVKCTRNPNLYFIKGIIDDIDNNRVEIDDWLENVVNMYANNCTVDIDYPHVYEIISNINEEYNESRWIPYAMCVEKGVYNKKENKESEIKESVNVENEQHDCEISENENDFTLTLDKKKEIEKSLMVVVKEVAEESMDWLERDSNQRRQIIELKTTISELKKNISDGIDLNKKSSEDARELQNEIDKKDAIITSMSTTARTDAKQYNLKIKNLENDIFDKNLLIQNMTYQAHVQNNTICVLETNYNCAIKTLQRYMLPGNTLEHVYDNRKSSVAKQYNGSGDETILVNSSNISALDTTTEGRQAYLSVHHEMIQKIEKVGENITKKQVYAVTRTNLQDIDNHDLSIIFDEMKLPTTSLLKNNITGIDLHFYVTQSLKDERIHDFFIDTLGLDEVQFKVKLPILLNLYFLEDYSSFEEVILRFIENKNLA